MASQNQADSSDFHRSLSLLSSQFDCNIANAEREGERLWDSLTALRAKDPQAYNDFIAKQLKHMNFGQDGEPYLNQESSSLAIPPFVPLHGFVVKTFIQPNKTKLFVNICQHDTAVQKPANADGDFITKSNQSFEGLKVPLLISKLRKCNDGSGVDGLAVDVVVNSWCLEACHNERLPLFKSQLISLVIESIEADHLIKLEISERIKWKVIKSKYKGGLGNAGSNVRPFEVRDSPAGESKCKTATTLKIGKNKAQCSPLDLIKLRNEDMNGSQCVNKVEVLHMPNNDKSIMKNNLVQEVPSKTNQTLAIKSGFLSQSNKKALYPEEGSTGDGSLGTGGTYARFMSKCKVIDTADTRALSSHEKMECNSFDRVDPEFHDMCINQDPQFASNFDSKDGRNNPDEFDDIARVLSDLSNAFS